MDAGQNGSYGYNILGSINTIPNLGLGGGWMMENGHYSNPRTFTRESQVLSPSDMLCVGDATLWDGTRVPTGCAELSMACISFGLFYNEVMRWLPPTNQAVHVVKQRHGGRWDMGFCDGHVENLRANDLFNLSNSIVARRWNNDYQPHNQWWVAPPP